MKVAVSGYFDPFHRGHRKHLEQALALGHVIVLIGSDEQIIRKYGYVLSPLNKRIERIRKKAPFIHGVVVSIDKDNTETATLKLVRPDVYAKGGDRVLGNIPKSEVDVCEEIGCRIQYGVGEKLNSSTAIRRRIEKCRKNLLSL